MTISIKNILGFPISRKGIPFTLAFLVFIIVELSVFYPWAIENIYSKGVYIIVANIVSFVSRLIPFSLWDITWIGSILMLVSGIILVIFRRLKIGKFILYLLQTGALIYSLFYLLWGFNYFRPRVEARIGLRSVSNNTELFETVLENIISQTNNNYISPANSDNQSIDKAIEESYRINAEEIGIIYPNGYRRPKEITLSELFASSGVSGYFGPFFSEIHVNKVLLHTEFPFVLAHEKAHQFGITSEAEANFYAFVVCTRSSDQRVRYSAYISILQYFLYEAYHLENYKDFVAKIDRKVITDIKEERKNWMKYHNKTIDKIQTTANDAYLKSNRIEDGVKNYNRVVALIMGWHKKKPYR
jgi:hypothetical protein